MNQQELFASALGLEQPWYIESIDFTPGVTWLEGSITLKLSFIRGTKFPGSDGNFYTAYDTTERKWQHLNFFQHKCFLIAPAPRIMLPNGKTEMVELPWTREGSHFTLFFEAFAMMLIEREMPISKVAKLMNVHDGVIRRVFNYHIAKALKTQDLSTLCSMGVDETSVKKGHNYVTVAVDLETREVIHVTDGKDKQTLKAVKEHLIAQNGKPEQVKHLSMDMSPAFIAGAQEHFPNASITFDKFHVVKLINKAMDDTRRAEQAGCKALKGTRYSWLKNDQNLEPDQIKLRTELAESFPRLGEAYRMKVQFNTFWTEESPAKAKIFLEEWCRKATFSGLKHFENVAITITKHLEGIVEHISTKINNGILEGINSKIQLAKKRARGYRNMDNFKAMIYYLCADLKLNLPM